MIMEKILIALGFGAAVRIHNDKVHDANNRVLSAASIATRMERQSGKTFDGIADRLTLSQQRETMRKDSEYLKSAIGGMIEHAKDEDPDSDILRAMDAP